LSLTYHYDVNSDLAIFLETFTSKHYW